MREQVPSPHATHDLDVVAIGSPLLDVIDMATEGQLAQVGLEKGSMTLVDLVKANAVQASMAAPRFVSGGSVANTAAGIAELGGRAGFVGAVADDEVGRTYTQNLLAAGVEFEPSVSESAAGDGLGTGRCVVLITDDADRTMGTYLGAASTLSPAGVSTSFVARASVVLLEGYLWDRACRQRRRCATLRQQLPMARSVLGGTWLGLSDPFCVERHQRDFLELLLDDVDILLGNEEEVTMLFGASSYRAALDAAEETGLLVVITRGAQGATVLTARGPEEVPAAPVERVLDTTGAGDLFAAGVLYGLTHADGPRREHPAGQPLRGRGDLAHWRTSRGRSQSAGGGSGPAAGIVAAVSLSIGIVGLPNVGKSTLFNALTHNEVLAANYPFATIDPNVGVVAVPDARLRVLSVMYEGAPVVPATVTFVDIAGLVRGASQGEGLGNQFLASIRETDAICQVVRAFHDDDVVHVDARVDPVGDIETVNTELILADLQTVENRLPKLAKETRTTPALRPTLEAVERAQGILDEGRTISAATAAGEVESALLRDLHLLTAKPFIYVFNIEEGALGDAGVVAGLAASIAPAPAIVLCAQIEAEVAGLEPDEAKELLDSYGQAESGLEQLVQVGFATLGLQTFLTAGPKEARAWTIHVGDTAPKAAGVIHTDFERGFIKAEVISFEDLVAAGSVMAARSAGKARMEGKEYVMRDGDVVEFRFNT